MASTPALDRGASELQAEPPALQRSRASRAGRIPLLVLIYMIGLAAFIAIDPVHPWILLVVTAVVAIGADGIIRAHPRGEFHTIADTAPYLFIPVLFTMSSALFLEDVVLSYWAVPAVMGAGALMCCALYAEHASVDADRDALPLAHFVLNAVTYLSAFGFYAASYGFEVELFPAAFAIGLVSMLLAVEVFREAEPDSVRALGFAGVIGVIAAEARWTLYFIPLDGFLAAIFLLLVFYLATGVISHYLTDDLDAGVLSEFVIVSAAGLAIVIAGRVYA